MYGDGFGVLPPFDPEHDLLTIEQFGCISKGKADDAYRHLGDPDFDFLRDVIHPAIRREPHVTAERALRVAIPTTRYHLTLLIWSVPLGVAAIAPSDPDQAPANRTFLIRVTDLLVNGATAGEEERLSVNNGRKAQVTMAKAAIARLKAQYVNAAGDEEPLLAVQFGHLANHDDSVTLHIWEIHSRAIDAWAVKVAQVKKLATGDVTWGSRNGDSVPGTMTVRPTPEMQSIVLASATSATAQSSLPGSAPLPWSSRQPAVIRVSVVNCVPAPVAVLLSALPTFADPLLGKVQYSVTGTELLPLPVPPTCRAPFRILVGVIAAVIVLLIYCSIYYLLYTRRWTRVTVRRPAGLQAWRLSWNAPVLVDDVVFPDETEVLHLELPTGVHRKLFYRNVLLVLRSGRPPSRH